MGYQVIVLLQLLLCLHIIHRVFTDENDCNQVRVCPYMYEPVCGTDGRTYSNECMLKIQKCTIPSLRLAYTGDCTVMFVGVYECHKYDRTQHKNNWHYVSITYDQQHNNFKWNNRAGVTWTLYPRDEHNMLNVGNDCPYFKDGYIEARFTADGVYGPWGEFYRRKGTVVTTTSSPVGENITIEGIISYDGQTPNKLHDPSCARISFHDISLQDAPFIEIASDIVSVSNVDLVKGIPYMLELKKPVEEELWHTYSLSVVINVGWCANEASDDSIRKGDYITMMQHQVKLTDEEMVYKKNVTLDCYSCADKRPKPEWGIVDEGVQCARNPTETYTHDTSIHGCNGWPRTDLETCKEYCRNNALPEGCKSSITNPICNYVIWDNNRDWPPGWCQLATTCTKEPANSMVVQLIRGTDVVTSTPSPGTDGVTTTPSPPAYSCSQGSGPRGIWVGAVGPYQRDCINQCLRRRQVDDSIKGCTFYIDPPGDCWCERDIDYVNTTFRWHVTCNFTSGTDVVTTTPSPGTAGDELKKHFGKVYRFQSKNYPARMMRHRGFEVWLDENDANNVDLYEKDSSFIIVPGLAGKGVSFQSLNYPDRFLRHRRWLCYIHVGDESHLFKNDASFIPHNGLAPNDSRYISFESVNYPGYYIRHSGFRVRVNRYENTDLFRQDASWLPTHNDCWSLRTPGCVNGHNIIKYREKSVKECKTLCSQHPECLAFEYGVAHGGGNTYRPRDCQLQNSVEYAGCNGKYYNLDLYVKEKCPTEPRYVEIGCYKDRGDRAISGGKINYPANDVIEKCYEKAKAAGNEYFAVQYNVECFTSRDAGQTYNRYGKGVGCTNGRGGTWLMTVYRVSNGRDVAPASQCPMERGFCVKRNGGDQNSGVKKFNNLDGNTAVRQKVCLAKCLAYPSATGCEVIWSQNNRGCYVHTQEVARGNNVARHSCWIFSKCRKRGMCENVRNSANKNLVGAFVPRCKADRTFEEKQCHGSTGYCWCVDPIKGNYIKGTKKGPGQGKVTCGKQDKKRSHSSVAWKITCIVVTILFVATLIRLIRYRQLRAKAAPSPSMREIMVQEAEGDGVAPPPVPDAPPESHEFNASHLPPTHGPVYVIPQNANGEGGITFIHPGPPTYYSLYPGGALVMPSNAHQKDTLPPPYM